MNNKSEKDLKSNLLRYKQTEYSYDFSPRSSLTRFCFRSDYLRIAWFSQRSKIFLIAPSQADETIVWTYYMASVRCKKFYCKSTSQLVCQYQTMMINIQSVIIMEHYSYIDPGWSIWSKTWCINKWSARICGEIKNISRSCRVLYTYSQLWVWLTTRPSNTGGS